MAHRGNVAGEGSLEELTAEASALLADRTTPNGLKLAVFGNHSLRTMCERLAEQQLLLLAYIDRDLAHD